MKTVFKVLCLLILTSVQSCDFLENLTPKKEDFENILGGNKVKPKVKYNYSTTVNGNHLKYSISNIQASVGEVVTIVADSDNEPKPEIIILLNSEEIAHFYNLPDSVDIKMTEPGVHTVTVEGYYGEGDARRSSIDITVEE